MIEPIAFAIAFGVVYGILNELLKPKCIHAKQPWHDRKCPECPR